MFTVCLSATAVVAMFGAASPAYAATCGGTGENVTAPVAATTFTWALCSDNSVQIWNGVLYDTNCDSRKAEAWFAIQVIPPGSQLWHGIALSPVYSAGNGCGSSSTYRNTTLTPSPDCTDCQHRFAVHLLACSTTCSSDYATYFYYFY